jgi:carbamoyltransferase
MKILGFQAGHDVSYCILENGIPIIHEELERFTREKEPFGDGLEMFFDHQPDYINLDKNNYSFSYGGLGYERGTFSKKSRDFNKMEDIVKKSNGKFYIIGHHQSHASNAFFSSNFDKALILTIDGGGIEKGNTEDWIHDTKELMEIGEYCNFRSQTPNMGAGTVAVTLWEGKNNKIYRIKAFNNHKVNIGNFWNACLVQIFGLRCGGGKGQGGNQAGTVMGMAPLGDGSAKYEEIGNQSCYKRFFNEFKKLYHGKIIWPNMYSYLKPLTDSFKKITNKGEQHKFNVAMGLQQATESIIKEIISEYLAKYPYKNLCVSGGVSLNAVAMGKMYDWFPSIENIYCDPVPYDGGLSLGSARYVWHHILDNPRIKWEDNSTSYLGRKYSLEDIEKAINKINNT